MSDHRTKSISQRSAFRISELVELFGFAKRTLEHEKQRGRLKAAHTGWIMRDEILSWGEKYQDRKIKKKAILASIDRLKSFLDTGKEEVSLPAQTNGDTQNLLSQDWLADVSGFNVDPNTILRASQLKDLIKARSEQLAVQEKQIRIYQDAGRLADVRECSLFVSRILTDVLDRVKKMPETLDAKGAKEADCSSEKARLVLGLARTYILEAIQQAANDIKTEEARFSSELSQRAKKPGRK